MILCVWNSVYVEVIVVLRVRVERRIAVLVV